MPQHTRINSKSPPPLPRTHTGRDRLLDVNPKGSVPVMHAGNDWLTDSGDIVDRLEADIPEPKLGTSADIPDMCVCACARADACVLCV